MTATRQEAQANDDWADELRSRIYRDREFMVGIRIGWDEGLRDEGMTVEEYIKSRGL